MKDLITMQREGREGIKQQHNFEILFSAGSMAEQACESFLDQHIANTWKACLATILESGLLEEKPLIKSIAYTKENAEATVHNTLARAVKAHLDELIKSIK